MQSKQARFGRTEAGEACEQETHAVHDAHSNRSVASKDPKFQITLESFSAALPA